MLLLLLTNVPVLILMSGIAYINYINKKRKTQLYFGIFVTVAIIWLAIQFFAQLLSISSSVDIELYLINLSAGISSWLAVTFYLFVRKYTNKVIKRSVLLWISAAALIFSLIGAFGKLINDVNVSIEGIEVRDAGGEYFIMLGLITFLFCHTLYSLIIATLRLPKHKRISNYLLIGSVLQAVMFISIGTIFFSESAAAQVVIPISFLVLVLLIYVGIFRFELFNIRILVARSVAYILSLSVVLFLFVGLFISVSNVLSLGTPSIKQDLLLGIAVVVSALAYGPLKKRFDKLSDKIFYRDNYSPQDVINTINSVLVNTIDLREMLDLSAQRISEKLKTSYVEFYIVGDEPLCGNADSWAWSDIRKSGHFIDCLMKLRDKVILDYNEKSNVDCPGLFDLMNKFGAACAVKLINNNKIVGLMIVGERKSGNAFEPHDVELLNAISSELSIAIQNALQYKEIEEFNVTLQEKVNIATRKLRRTNEKLKQIDKSKDEFISMASHQLRTPLTSVKGYVSMVLEGDVGEINEGQRKMLTQAFVSSQRMASLIADLLNVSRLRTGKFVIEPSAVDLSRLVDDEISQLKETASGRGLTLEFKKPTSFPVLMLDETKTRQVVMNFVDNAIYYTPSGGEIEVLLRSGEKSVDFVVRDNGIGVPKTEQPHLFTKFFRAGNARKARPDGTGLGLFMAKKVIVAQGGAVTFKSTEGKGSEFGFTFPLNKVIAK